MAARGVAALPRIVAFAAVLVATCLRGCGTAPGEQSLAVLNRTAAHVNVEFLDGRHASIEPCSAYTWRGSEGAVWTLRHRDQVVVSGQLAGQGARRAVAITVMPDGSFDVDVSLDGVVTDPPDPHPCEGELTAPPQVVPPSAEPTPS